MNHVFNACLCCNVLLSTSVHSFLGCSFHEECKPESLIYFWESNNLLGLCCLEEFCIKFNTPLMPIVFGTGAGFLFMIGCPCCLWGLKVPDKLCKTKNQVLSVTVNAAFPLDMDTPLMLAVLGLMCFPKIACCAKIAEVQSTTVLIA